MKKAIVLVLALTLQVEAVTPREYVFRISTDGKTFRQIGEPLDGRTLKAPDLWGFTGAVCGVYASTILPEPPAVGTRLPRGEAPEALKQAADDYLQTLADADEDIHSLMVLQHGKVLVDRHPAPDTAHFMMSVSKTFTSLAVGFAIHEGLLRLDDRLVDLFPESVPDSAQEALSRMTIRHLLMMNSGHGTDPTGRVWQGEWLFDGDWVREFLLHPVDYEPGTCYLYNTLGTFVLSAAVQRVSGQKTVDFLDSRLWRPLGIPKPRWDENPAGINLGGWGLFLRTEDMAKVGLCLLQKGVFDGRQVIPADWVAEMSANQTPCCPAGLNSRTMGRFNISPDSDWIQGYGYQMWRCYPEGVFRADGAWGQYIIVIPDRDAVVVMTGRTRDMAWQLQQVWERILPAL